MGQQSSPSHPSVRYNEGPLAKLVTVPGLLVTSVVAWLLIAQTSSQWRSPREVAFFVSENRATTALIVQVISHLLGLVYLYTLRTTIDLSCRSFFARSPLSLDTIRLANAFQTSNWNWSLSWPYKIMLVFYMLVGFLPAALWAGAITPVVTTKATEKPMTLPAFKNTTWIGWPQPGAPQTNLPKGYFTYKPEKVLQGLLLNAGSDASYVHEGSTSHAKLDKTGYSYVNRSYGIGAAVGLSDTAFTGDAVQYTYFETGLRSSVSCLYNTSTSFHLGRNEANAGWDLQVYEAVGTLPHNNESEIDFVAVGYSDSDIVAVASNANSYNTKYHFVGFATGNTSTTHYRPLSQVQCELIFAPHNFSVNVNASAVSRTILVEPLEQIDDLHAHWISDSNLYDVIWKCKDVINQLGSILATTMGTSVFGDTFMLNIANAERTYGKSDATNIRAIEDSLTSIVDNSLQALSSAQLILMKDTTSTTVLVMYPSVVFGKPIYIYIIFTLNVLVTAFYFAEMFRTRFWRFAPRFAFTDIGDVIVAASGGGKGIFDAVAALSSSSSSSHASSELPNHGRRGGGNDGYSDIVDTVRRLPIWLGHSSSSTNKEAAVVLGLGIKNKSGDSHEDITYSMVTTKAPH